MTLKNNKSDNQLSKLKKQVENYLDSTMDARILAERDRDYYDGNQWTDEERQTLLRRKQAPVVINRIRPKVNGLKGLLSIRNTEIKAFPRNEGSDEGAAHAITDALRFVDDNNKFNKKTKKKCFADKIVEGCCAAIVEVGQKKDDIEIKINRIPWDRFYYDPYSREEDFSDAKYLGQILWMDEEDVNDLFPNVDLGSLEDATIGSDETFEDRPRWILNHDGRKRLRLAQHFFLEKGVWNVAVFVGNKFLLKPEPSPFLDEDGEPECPIVADSAYIDRNNQRHGEVRSFIDPQNEINHRRSKALHLLSSRQTVSRNGAITKVADMKREMAKPDGHIVYNGDKGDFDLLTTGDFTQGQFALYEDAKGELDSSSFNAQLAGERQSGNLSGKAIDKLQNAGTLEINHLYDGFTVWENRIFEKVYNRIKQYWTREKWIRITEDQDNMRFVGLNTQITLAKFLEEQINDEAQPLEKRIGATATFQAMSQAEDPRLQAVIEVRNNPAELDVDIILDESFDVINMQQEQFQILAQFAQSSKDIDIIELIDLSDLKNKDQLIEKIEKRRAQMAQANGNLQQAQAQEAQVKNAKTFADTQLVTKKAEQMAIENALMIKNPDNKPQVNI